MRVRGTPTSSLWGTTLGFFFGFAAVALFGPSASVLADAMELSPVRLALLVAMPALSGSLLRIPFAATVESNGGRKPFLLLMLLSACGMAALSALVVAKGTEGFGPSDYPVLLLLGLLCGCGIATFSVGIGQVAYWFPRGRQGYALGVFAGVGTLAPGIFSFLMPLAIVSLGLGASYVLWTVVLLAGTAAYARMAHPAWFFQLRQAGTEESEARRLAEAAGQESFPSGGALDSLKASARAWRTWALVGIYFAGFGGFLAMTAWLPVFWRHGFGASVVAAGWLTALYSLSAAAIRVPGGAVADRFGGASTAKAALAAMGAGAAVVVFAGSIPVAAAGILAMAAGMGVANAAVFKMVAEKVPHAIGGASGWVGGLGAFGGFAVAPLLGWVVEARGASGYSEGFLVFVLLAAASWVAAWAIGRRPAAAQFPSK